MAIFEDAFTELQAELLGACMEFLGEPVDKVYAYLYQEPSMLTTNFFFRKNGQIYSNGQIGDRNKLGALFQFGTQTLLKLQKLCREHDRSCPTEARLVFDPNTRQFDAAYRYDAPSDDYDPDEAFTDWKEKERKR